eukprot:CAMPEP_0204618644 /NCGR_PEP_ID=MMETSP0717-20131115/5230_1 /ASSEMBLY_ACC=CAM_ASM_000666 /TAXON_ID=230516 /ORGANISM="Chaetoceros curvisetus" /LENGTH=45 /DNA_ID= /DNA_START= /DNA_END= /DNA_ORIENTATION=
MVGVESGILGLLLFRLFVVVHSAFLRSVTDGFGVIQLRRDGTRGD